MNLLRISELRNLEARHDNALPSLMERAGAAAARLAMTLSPENTRSLICAGPGNNGGDAFVLAREICQHDRTVTVLFRGNPTTLSTDAQAAYAHCLGSGIKFCTEVPPDHYGLVVDGLFGIGLKRQVDGDYADLIARINNFTGPVLALDVPSGLDADSGRVLGIAVRASHTITFISAKPGLYTLDGPDHCGRIHVEELGLSAGITSGALLTSEDFRSQLHPRRQNSHKGSYGSLAIMGGAAGMTGAALLAARAALHLGAGRVFVGLLAERAVDYHQPELMLRTPIDAMAQATALVAGPGLGQSTLALELLRRAASADFPLLIDADAITLIGAHPVLERIIARRTHATVLTPHPAEAARLLHCDTATIQADRVSSALEIAKRFNACVALKGCGTVLANPDGRWRINTRGNPGLASGGTGDVLAGLTGALLAQQWPAWNALCLAVHLHGAAAETCVLQGIGPIGLVASELIAPARSLLNAWIADSQRSE